MQFCYRSRGLETVLMRSYRIYTTRRHLTFYSPNMPPSAKSHHDFDGTWAASHIKQPEIWIELETWQAAWSTLGAEFGGIMRQEITGDDSLEFDMITWCGNALFNKIQEYHHSPPTFNQAQRHPLSSALWCTASNKTPSKEQHKRTLPDISVIATEISTKRGS